jgi:hypothetical protein
MIDGLLKYAGLGVFLDSDLTRLTSQLELQAANLGPSDAIAMTEMNHEPCWS